MLIVTTAAIVEPVTAAEAKAQLRVTHSSDDALIAGLITSAREAAEQSTGRALAAAEYRWVETGDMSATNRLPLWPVESVESVSYEDADGVRQTLDPTAYTLDGDRAIVYVGEMPAFAANASISFTVNPAHVPSAVKDAIKLFVEDLYTDPKAKMENNSAADRLLYPFRVSLGV